MKHFNIFITYCTVFIYSGGKVIGPMTDNVKNLLLVTLPEVFIGKSCIRLSTSLQKKKYCMVN